MDASTYYVMHSVDGDECLVAHCAAYEDAEAKVREHHASMPRADLSIWSSDGEIVAVMNESGALRRV